MTPSGNSRRLLPSLADFIFLTPAFFIFGRMSGARALLGDADTGWHVRTGQWILENHAVPAVDLFSYTKPGEPWFAWEWLSDILMALAHKAGGLEALVLGSVALICLTCLLLFRLTLSKCDNALVAYCVTIAATAGSAIHWLARPHLFTLLFLIVFYQMLDRDDAPRRLWWLPPLMVLWANLHGGFFIGVALIGTYAAGEWITGILARDSARAKAFAKGNHYAAVGCACFAATFLNPYTWHLHWHLFDYLTNPGYFQEIQEFLPISFRHPLSRFYEPMLFLAAGAAFWLLRKGRYTTFLLLAVWAHLSLVASRNIPVFLLLAAPPVASFLARAMSPVSGSWSRLFARLESILNTSASRPSWHVLSLTCLILLGVQLYRPAPGPLFRAEFDPTAYPATALRSLQPGERVFTDDEWGDYLIYRSSGTRKVFVDGRSDFYGPAFEGKYLDILSLRGSWKGTLDQYKVDTILARSGGTLSGGLRESTAWSVVYQDQVATIFRRTAPFSAR